MERLKVKSTPLCIHDCKQMEKYRIEQTRIDVCVHVCISLHIDINNTCFKDISNLEGIVLFLIFYVTEYLQIGPILCE